ncbi:hypothetical protein DPMN_108695 [Dreissena polymorpha]|uniref:Uncharacterized protein n=1 Tax=Dreissena polymorpha TaxID=45954 RepID=A0A9D4K9C7_DREPO|nr:hypothetical protein DPMN_108695 [Dreissena polymorpha]
MMTPAMVGGSGSPAEFSPVLGPVLSLANALSHGPLFTNQSGHHGNTTLTRKPSVGPHEKFEVERLTSVIVNVYTSVCFLRMAYPCSRQDFQNFDR